MPAVLIVEDEEPLRVLAQSILDEHGLTTLTAANATEALAILGTADKIEILFTDIQLGGDSGIDLAQQARTMVPDLAVLYTTGAGVTDGTRALFVENSGFLPKPYTVEQLVQAIEAVRRA